MFLSGYLEENSPIMTAVRWSNYSLPKVSDPDSGLNGTIDLLVNSEQFFTIQPNWGIRELMFSLLSKVPTIDYEVGPREINLVVSKLFNCLLIDRNLFSPGQQALLLFV